MSTFNLQGISLKEGEPSTSTSSANPKPFLSHTPIPRGLCRHYPSCFWVLCLKGYLFPCLSQPGSKTWLLYQVAQETCTHTHTHAYLWARWMPLRVRARGHMCDLLPSFQPFPFFPSSSTPSSAFIIQCSSAITILLSQTSPPKPSKCAAEQRVLLSAGSTFLS